MLAQLAAKQVGPTVSQPNNQHGIQKRRKADGPGCQEIVKANADLEHAQCQDPGIIKAEALFT